MYEEQADDRIPSESGETSKQEWSGSQQTYPLCRLDSDLQSLPSRVHHLAPYRARSVHAQIPRKTD